MKTTFRPTRLRSSTPPPSPDPTPAEPGTRTCAAPIYRAHDDRARWNPQTATAPTAACTCRCGYTDTACGGEDVAALAAAYDQHRTACR
ncbi:hypothetical protein AB0M68_27905 [Streptomyces sp. NPDC051453]|uniref:hypothetical protein n=1 Tax=Streptomyces sp. NPDC051453 TaxID=3154941 RepID=UPI00343DAEC7